MSLPSLAGAGVRRGGRWLLEGVDFTPHAGGLCALVGPNGAGKTTLLRLLAGLLAPDAGEARWGDRPLAAVPRRELARAISYLPQTARPTFGSSVEELVLTGRYAHRGRFSAVSDEERELVRCALAEVDALAFIEQPVNTLSGGELQRVLLARCLVTEAPLLLLDEPTAHLDLAQTLGLLALLRRLADEGRTIVLAIHDLEAALRVTDRLAVLQHGRLLAHEAPELALPADRLRDVFGLRRGERGFELAAPEDG